MTAPGGNGAFPAAGDWEPSAGYFPCAGYPDCKVMVDDEEGICDACYDRNEQENAGGCPGCGGNCQTACR